MTGADEVAEAGEFLAVDDNDDDDDDADDGEECRCDEEENAERGLL